MALCLCLQSWCRYSWPYASAFKARADLAALCLTGIPAHPHTGILKLHPPSACHAWPADHNPRPIPQQSVRPISPQSKPQPQHQPPIQAPTPAWACRHWDTTTDVAPIHFLLPALLHLLWVVLAIATAVGHSQRCQDAPPSQIHYQVLMWALFLIFCLSAVVEVALVCVGFRGTALGAVELTAVNPVMVVNPPADGWKGLR